MKVELAQTGISVMGELPWGSHICHFYETKGDLLNTLLPYFQAGLENNEYCLWVIAEPIREEEVREVLTRLVPEAVRHLSEGRLEIIPQDGRWQTGGRPNARLLVEDLEGRLERALEAGYAGMRVGGARAATTERHRDETSHHDRSLDNAFAGKRTLLLCSYPLAAMTAAEILAAVRAHEAAFVRRRGEWEVIESAKAGRLRRELERLNVELERRVVERTRELAERQAELKTEAARRETVEASERESRQLYEALVQSIDGIVCEMDGRTFRVNFVSEKAVDILGYPVERWLSDPDFWLQHLHPSDRARAARAKARAAAGGKGRRLSYRMIAADGGVVWFRDVMTVNVGSDGRPLLRGVKVDITELKRVEKALRESKGRFRALSASLQTAKEVESARIAREIHDDLGGALTGLRWDLERLARQFSDPSRGGPQPEAVRERLEAMLRLTETTIGSLRRITQELRPSVLDDLGLADALEWQAQQFQSRTGIACRCDCSLEDLRLEGEQATAVFRIFQEALTNVLRHSGADSVEVSAKREGGEFVLTVSDNGRGITEEEKAGGTTLGLLGMRERAYLAGGELEIEGAAGKGTTVTVRLPIRRE